MNTNLNKKVEQNIYAKPNKSYYNQFYDSYKNYNNIFVDLLEDNKIDNSKNIMISELDIDINTSQNVSFEEILQNKNSKTIKNSETKNEFKKQLTDNIIRYLQKNKEKNSKSFHDTINKKDKGIISKTKNALNLTSISPKSNKFKTLNVNKNNNELKMYQKDVFIKINRRTNDKRKNLVINNNKKKESIIKKMKTKNFKSIIEKFNSNTYKKLKTNNSIFNHPHKSLLINGVKKFMNIPSINNKKRKNSTNINKNFSFIRDNKKSNTLRTSFNNSMVKSTFKQIKSNRILNSNSKLKEKLEINNKKLFSLCKDKYALTENNINNTIKNVSHKNNEGCTHFKTKPIPKKYRNLTLKDINSLNNNILNLNKNNFNSFVNSISNKEKERNFATNIYEKKKLKRPLTKQFKIHVRKNIKNNISKNPINIINININRNNNIIMSINNEHYINTINNNKVINSSSKMEGKIRKFFSFQKCLDLTENSQNNNLKRINNIK